MHTFYANFSRSQRRHLPVCILWCAFRCELLVYAFLQPEKIRLTLNFKRKNNTLTILWAVSCCNQQQGVEGLSKLHKNYLNHNYPVQFSQQCLVSLSTSVTWSCWYFAPITQNVWLVPLWGEPVTIQNGDFNHRGSSEMWFVNFTAALKPACASGGEELSKKYLVLSSSNHSPYSRALVTVMWFKGQMKIPAKYAGKATNTNWCLFLRIGWK